MVFERPPEEPKIVVEKVTKEVKIRENVGLWFSLGLVFFFLILLYLKVQWLEERVLKALLGG